MGGNAAPFGAVALLPVLFGSGSILKAIGTGPTDVERSTSVRPYIVGKIHAGGRPGVGGIHSGSHAQSHVNDGLDWRTWLRW